jgi:DNA-3-methyladenine glycosylase II
MNANFIKKLIQNSYPELSKLLAAVEPVEPLVPLPITVLDAVSHIVIGQMLSRKATKTIINKAVKLSINKKLPGIACLPDTDLRNCGVSGRKSKTIHLFADHYHKNKQKIENWRNLSPENLYNEVNSHWGLSDWSASMLGIFYFGLEDIFPFEDGSIKKALKNLHSINIFINPHLVAPYKSYLALYLWKLLDSNMIDA